MTAPHRDPTSAAYGRMLIQMSLVWAATMLGTAVVHRASDEFVYIIFVLIGGFSLSSAVLESGRRRILDRDRS